MWKPSRAQSQSQIISSECVLIRRQNLSSLRCHTWNLIFLYAKSFEQLYLLRLLLNLCESEWIILQSSSTSFFAGLKGSMWSQLPLCDYLRIWNQFNPALTVHEATEEKGEQITTLHECLVAKEEIYVSCKKKSASSRVSRFFFYQAFSLFK